VADYDNNRIEAFAPDGTFLTEWGEEGSAPGQFTEPIYLTVNEAAEVFVSEAAATPEAAVPATSLSRV
jgi:hypothetical protein